MHTTISVQPQSANVEKTRFFIWLKFRAKIWKYEINLKNLAYTVCRPHIEEGGQALRFEVEQS